MNEALKYHDIYHTAHLLTSELTFHNIKLVCEVLYTSHFYNYAVRLCVCQWKPNVVLSDIMQLLLHSTEISCIVIDQNICCVGFGKWNRFQTNTCQIVNWIDYDSNEYALSSVSFASTATPHRNAFEVSVVQGSLDAFVTEIS